MWRVWLISCCPINIYVDAEVLLWGDDRGEIWLRPEQNQLSVRLFKRSHSAAPGVMTSHSGERWKIEKRGGKKKREGRAGRTRLLELTAWGWIEFHDTDDEAEAWGKVLIGVLSRCMLANKTLLLFFIYFFLQAVFPWQCSYVRVQVKGKRSFAPPGWTLKCPTPTRSFIWKWCTLPPPPPL